MDSSNKVTAAANEVKPRAMEYTDFQDGTLGRWILSAPHSDYEIGDEQGNRFLRVSTKPGISAGFSLSPPSLPFVLGRRYRLQARYQSAGSGMAGLSMKVFSGHDFFPPTTPGDWGMASSEGIYDGSSSVVYLGVELLTPDSPIKLDNVGVYEIQ